MANFCLKKIEELKPKWSPLDLQMPGMNGIDTLKEIMRRHPIPVIVVSSHSIEGASITFKGTGVGCISISSPNRRIYGAHGDAARQLIAKIKAAAIAG